MPRDGSNIFSPPAGTLATPATPIESAKYNAFVNDLTADLNLPRPIVAGGTGASTAGGALTALGAQPLDADLTAIAALTSAANKLPYATGAGTWALTDLTAAGRAILGDADAAAQRTTLGLVIGTNVQAYDAALQSLAGLSLVAGDILYATGADTLVRLPKGTAGQALVMNAGATAPEWAAPSSGAPSTAEVLAATAGAAVGDVGSYAFLRHATSATTLTAGSTYAGSALRYSGVVSTPALDATGGTPAGTWRCMGTVGGVASQTPATLFLRTV